MNASTHKYMNSRSLIALLCYSLVLMSGVSSHAGFTIAATEDRPFSVPADRWVLLAPNLGMVVVPSRTEITGYVAIDGNRIPMLNTTLGSGYFMFRGLQAGSVSIFRPNECRSMTPAEEGKWISTGCQFVTLGACVLGYLATKGHWTSGVAAALVILAWVLAIRHRGQVEERIILEALGAIFRPTGRPAPALQRAGSYGYPRFILVFASEADLGAAQTEGCIAAFKEFIQSRYADFGSNTNPFDANLSVCVTWSHSPLAR